MPASPNYSVPPWIRGASPLEAAIPGAQLGVQIAESNRRSALAYMELQRRQAEFEQQMQFNEQKLQQQQEFEQQRFQAQQAVAQQNQLREDQQLKIENSYKQAQIGLKQQQIDLTRQKAAGQFNATGKFMESLNMLKSGYMAEEGMDESAALQKAVPQALFDSGLFQYLPPNALAGMMKSIEGRQAAHLEDVPGGGQVIVQPSGTMTPWMRPEKKKTVPEPRFSVSPPDPSDPASQARVRTVSGLTAPQLRQFGITNVGPYQVPQGTNAPATPTQAKKFGMPEVGAVIGGYTFKGGNPADQSNWQLATEAASTEEKPADESED